MLALRACIPEFAMSRLLLLLSLALVPAVVAAPVPRDVPPEFGRHGLVARADLEKVRFDSRPAADDKDRAKVREVVAKEAEKAGKPEETLACLARLDSEPCEEEERVEWAALRAWALSELSRIDEALATLAPVLTEYPSAARLHAALGVVLSNDGNLEAACEALETAIGLDETDDVAIANLGLVLLLFLIGLEIDLRKILSQGRLLLVAGLLQFPLCVGAGWGAARLAERAGLPGLHGGYAAVYVGIVAAASSTLLVARLLQERFQMDTASGRVAVGLLILQDVWAIVVLAAQRTRQIMKGSPALVSGKNKAAVMALREIGEGKVHWNRNSQEAVQEWIDQTKNILR